jgi:hypothetical protein
MTGALMDKPRDKSSDEPTPQQHDAANEAGVPKTAEERRQLRRALMRKHRAAYEALGNS